MMITGKVADVIQGHPAKIVLNRGAQQGVRPGMKFLVYSPGKEIKDPDSGRVLGNLEITKGRFVVESVQPLLTTAVLVPSSLADVSFGATLWSTEVKIGDLFRQES